MPEGYFKERLPVKTEKYELDTKEIVTEVEAYIRETLVNKYYIVVKKIAFITNENDSYSIKIALETIPFLEPVNLAVQTGRLNSRYQPYKFEIKQEKSEQEQPTELEIESQQVNN